MSNSEELLKDTVFQLLDRHNNYDKTFQEILSWKQTCDTPVDWNRILSNTSSDVSNISYTSDVCISKLLALTSSSTLQADQKIEVQLLVKTLQKIKKNGRLNLHENDKFYKECENLPLEVIWTLHKEGVFSLENYISLHFGKKSSIQSFISKLSIDEAGKLPEYVSEIVSEMIGICFIGDNIDSNMKKKKILEIVDKIILRMVDNIIDGTVDKDDSMLELNIYLNLNDKKKAYSHILSTIICHQPVMKVSQAIREQNKWSYGNISPALTHLYKQLLLVFDVTETLTLVREILEQQEVNWQLILSLVSNIVVCMPESSKLFLDFIDTLLSEGLENNEFETTIMAMLLARQACCHGPHVFPSYNDWFQRCFYDSSRSLANTRKSFTFLMKFLTNLLPYESAEHIKVHILHPPHVPSKCRQILTDYITTAKTRLVDLKESLDNQLYDVDNVFAGKSSAGISDEVDNAIKLYEMTHKVPTSLFEASIFRKPYYLGQFLPVLLQPRPLPDFPDSRMGLISALKKADKIPQSMYTSYQKACRKEASQLLEGIEIDSDCDMELSPLEQQADILRQLINTVTAICSQKKSKYTVLEMISLICKQLEILLIEKSDDLSATPGIISIYTTNIWIESSHIKVIDMLLNTVTQCISVCYSSSSPIFTWLSDLLLSFKVYPKLLDSLYKRLWILVIDQGISLESHHIECISAILVEIQVLNDKLLLVDIGDKSIDKCRKTLTEYIIDMLPLTSKQWMNYSLQLFGSYLKYLFTVHQDVDQYLTLPSVVKKFIYLASRIHPELRNYDNTVRIDGDNTDMVSTIYNSDVFKHLAEVCPLTVEEWVGYEIVVCPEKDVLTEMQRHEYFSWIIYRYFLLRQVNNENIYLQLASCVVKQVLNNERSNTQQTSKCIKCINQLTTSTNNSRSIIIHILYEIIQMFVSTNQSNDTSVLPWLPQQLVDILKTTESKINNQSLVQRFFQLCQSLPSYLMFTDTLHIPICDDRLHLLVDFINTMYRQYISEGVYLPARVTTYLLQGMSYCRHISMNTDLIQQFCHQCPIVLVSAMVNTPLVRPMLEQLKGNDCIILQLMGNMQSKNCSQIKDPWELAVIFFSEIVNVTARDVPSLWNNLSMISYSASIQKHVYSNLVQMLILQLSYIEEFMEPQDNVIKNRISTSLTQMLEYLTPGDITELIFNTDLCDNIKLCTTDNLMKIRSFTLLKFLKSRQQFYDKYTSSSFLTGLLQTLIDCNSILDEDKNTADKHSGQGYTELNDFVLSIIKSTNRSILHDINEELLLQAGPVIADCAIRRMSV
ncbi:hypothetical protein ACF0H5_006425 [Mactra antiquata]